MFTPADAHAYLAAKLDAEPNSDRMREAEELAADSAICRWRWPRPPRSSSTTTTPAPATAPGSPTGAASWASCSPTTRWPMTTSSTVAATWSISIDAADQLAPVGLARPLLQIASVLDPNGFPTDLIDTPAVLDYLRSRARRDARPAISRPARGDGRGGGQDSRDALANLARLSLVDRLDAAPTGGPAGVRVHALVQRATLQHLDRATVARLVRVAADALMQIWPEIEHDPQLGQTLRSNTAAVRGHDPDALWKPDGHPVLFRAGHSLGRPDWSPPPWPTGPQMVHEADRLPRPRPPRHPDHPRTTSPTGGAAGDPAGPSPPFEQLLADRLRVLGPDHPDTLTTRDNLARWRGGGDPAGAAAAFEQAAGRPLRVLGPDHPDTLTTRSNIARLAGAAGDPAGAAAALRAAARRPAAGAGPRPPRHPDHPRQPRLLRRAGGGRRPAPPPHSSSCWPTSCGCWAPTTPTP